MSFFDNVGSFYAHALKAFVQPGSALGPLAEDVGPLIGSAWTAASNADKFAANNTYTKPIYQGLNPLGTDTPGRDILNHGTDALNLAFSYGISRNVSTLTQMGNPSSNFLSASDWNRAYNRSAEISPGQAIATNFITGLHGDNGRFGGVADPFSAEADADRNEYFTHTWAGKLTSGGLDLALNLGADPTAFAGKGIKFTEKTLNVVKDEDKATVLARSIDPKVDASRIQQHQANKASKLIDRFVDTPTGLIPAMPELERSADAGAYAQLMQSAKDNARSREEARVAIADILGTAWGDKGSMDRLVARRDGLATQMQALSSAPAVSVNGLDLSKRAISTKQAEMDTMLDDYRDMIDEQLVRMQNVLGNGEKQAAAPLAEARVSGDARGRRKYNQTVGSTNYSNVRTADDTTETYIHVNANTPAVRLMSWGNQQAVGRIPGAIHLKDSVAGYQDFTRVLGLMHWTPPEIKQNLLDSFVNAVQPNHRANVVKKLNNQITIDAGRKHGMSDEAIKTALKEGGDEMEFWHKAWGSRLYSAADDATHVGIYDPEEDIFHVGEKAFATSHVEDHHPVLDPRTMEKALGRVVNGPSPEALQNAGMVAGTALKEATGLWKFSALLRLAYPFRIQTDSQARLAVHMDMAQFFLTRKAGAKAVAHYFATSKDNETRSLKNIFKEGDLEGAVKKILDLDTGHGPMYQVPEEEYGSIFRTVLSENGGVADLGDELSNAKLRRVRNGDWRVMHPPARGAGKTEKEDYRDNYLRVINRQIKNSPAMMEFVQGWSIDNVAELVRHQLIHGGELASEYRAVGKNFDSIEEWLARSKANVDHYLPHPEMREKMMDRVKMAPPEGAPTKSAHAKAMGQKTVNKAVHDDYKATYGDYEEVPVKGGLTKWDVDEMFYGKNAIVDPMDVHGEMYSVVEQSKLKGWYNGKRKKWFAIMADMPETVLARSPLFWDSYRKSIDNQLAQLPEEYITMRGADAIRHSAMRQARKDMGRILYDASDSSNMAHTMRYVSPFFTAWEDTMRKWSGLLYDNPEILPRINQLAKAPAASGGVVDANGNHVDVKHRSWDKNGHLITDPNYQAGGEFIMLPQKLTSWIPGPLTEGQLKIRKDSINSVFQGDPFWLPGFGPMVQVPANKVVRDVFPKETENPVIKYLLPYGTTTDSATTQLLPKWAKSAVNVFGSGREFSNQYGIYLAEETIDARSDGRDVDIKAVQRKTRNYFIAKAFTDNASPVSIAPNPKYQLYVDKAHEYRNDKTRADWIGDFMRDFPGYGEMGITLSANNTGIVATDAAFDASKRYRADIAADPEHGWMIVGPANAGGAFSSGVYDWQGTHEAGFGKSFRGKQDPQTAIQNIQVQQGWSTWNSFMTQINLIRDHRGLVSLQQKGGEDLEWVVSAAREQLAGKNKAWGAAQDSASHGGAGRLLDTATDFMAKHAEVRSRPDMVALQQYMDFREQVKQVLATRPNKSLAYNPDIKFALDAGAKQLVQNNIGFEAMYNRVLQYDDLTDVKINPDGSVRT